MSAGVRKKDDTLTPKEQMTLRKMQQADVRGKQIA